MGLKHDNVFPASRKRVGLNRTSVGLKQDDGDFLWEVVSRLNRTSVGLKLLHTPDSHGSPPRGLNRTSVGLKLDLVARELNLHHTSIEPAWD